MKPPYELHPFQKEGAIFLAGERNSYYLADEMGLGKTAQAIQASVAINAQKVWIICTASTKLNWKRELMSWGAQEKDIFVFKSTKCLPSIARYVIISYDMLHYKKVKQSLKAHLEKHGHFDVVILDEAHYLKTPSAKRTRALLGTRAHKGLLACAKKRWFLSGTPVLNRPKELYAVLRTMAPELLGEYTEWVEFGKRYCNGFYEELSGYNFNGQSNLEELSKRLSPFMLRRLKADVQAQLPPVLEQVLYLQHNYVDSELDPLSTRMRLLGVAKVPAAVAHIEDILESKDKVLVFAHHTEVISQLAQHFNNLGQAVAVIRGGLTAEQKQQELKKFIENPECKVLVGQILAAGTGVDGLQEVCDHVVFVEYSWSPGVLAQAVDRLHRMGQTKPVNVQYLIFGNTIEEMVCKVVKAKKKVISEVVEHTVRKPVMPIEELLLGIKTAVERIAMALEANNGVSEAPTAVIETKKTGKKAVAPVETPQQQELTEVVEASVLPETPENTSTSPVTFDDVHVAMTAYTSNVSEAERNIRIANIREKVYPILGVQKLGDLKSLPFGDPKFVEALMLLERVKAPQEAALYVL